MSIDSHSHIFLRTLPMAARRRYTPDYDATLAAYLAMLDSEGCTHGVLIQPSFLGYDNSFLVNALERYPNRLRGVVALDPGIERSALEELNRRGVVGVRLNLIGEADPELASPIWRRHVDMLASLGWQVEIQAEAARLQHLLPPLIAARVNVVIDHFGRPDPSLGVNDPGFQYLLGAASSGQVFVRLSAAYRLGTGERGSQVAAEGASLLLKAFGSRRLIWGSDWPHTQFEKLALGAVALRRDLDHWVPNPAERDSILWSTPAALFKFEAGSLTLGGDKRLGAAPF